MVIISKAVRTLPPLPPIPTNEAVHQQEPHHHHHDQSISTNNALNLSNSSCNINGGSPLQNMPVKPNKNVVGVGFNGQMIDGVIPTVHNGGVGDENINQMEINDLNDIYYSDLDCKQIQF